MEGPCKLELEGLGLDGEARGRVRGWSERPRSCRLEPGEMAREHLEIRSELARGVEGVGVKDPEGALDQGRRRPREGVAERQDRIVRRRPRTVAP